MAAWRRAVGEVEANFTADGALEGDIVEDLAGRLWRK
jgi:hypothetical protein